MNIISWLSIISTEKIFFLYFNEFLSLFSNYLFIFLIKYLPHQLQLSASNHWSFSFLSSGIWMLSSANTIKYITNLLLYKCFAFCVPNQKAWSLSDITLQITKYRVATLDILSIMFISRHCGKYYPPTYSLQPKYFIQLKKFKDERVCPCLNCSLVPKPQMEHFPVKTLKCISLPRFWIQ